MAWIIYALVAAALLAFSTAAMAQEIPDCQQVLADPCTDPAIVTPDPVNDVLLWDQVLDPALAGYRIVESNLSGVEMAVWDLPATATSFPVVPPRGSDRVMSIRSKDIDGLFSAEASECIWRSGPVWDCVEEARPECPDACVTVCTAMEPCDPPMAFECCTEAHLEPPGCQICTPPIGGREIWP